MQDHNESTRKADRRGRGGNRSERSVGGRNGGMGGRTVSNVRAFRHCGESDKQPYHYTECGLDNVYLFSGYDIELDPEYGETVSVKDAAALHVAIGIALCQTKKTLSGAELRFLRKEMELTQSRLAGLIGSTAQSVARWEKSETPQPTAADLFGAFDLFGPRRASVEQHRKVTRRVKRDG